MAFALPADADLPRYPNTPAASARSAAEDPPDELTESRIERTLFSQRQARKGQIAAHKKTCFDVTVAVEEQNKNTPSEPHLLPPPSCVHDADLPISQTKVTATAVMGEGPLDSGFAALRAQAALRRKKLTEFGAVTDAASNAVRQSTERLSRASFQLPQAESA